MSARPASRRLSSGNVRADVLRQDRGIWYTFTVPSGGTLTLLGHELRALADLADQLATEYETVRAIELARMKSTPPKPLRYFGRRKVAR